MRKVIPSSKDLESVLNSSIPDIIKSDLKILFCGINPGLYTAYVKQHFGRPGNKFWKALYQAKFTPNLFHPSEQYSLLTLGYGITNLVNRATVSQADLKKEEFVQGGKKLTIKAEKYKPEWISFVGIDAYRQAFNFPKAVVGRQEITIGTSKVWLLPSTSGLNAFYTLEKLTILFGELRNEVR